MSRMKVTSSRVEGTATQEPKTDAVDVGLGVLDTALPLFGVAGNVAGVPISLIMADRDANKKLQDITNKFRLQIAGHFKIPAEIVSQQMMLQMASRHEGIGQMVRATWAEKDSQFWTKSAGIAGGVAGVGAAALLASGPPGWLAAALWSGGGALIGSSIGDGLFGTYEGLNPMTHLKAIEEKRGKVSELELAADIFRLHVSLNEGLRAHLEHKYGKAFFGMDAEDQLRVMNEFPALLNDSIEDARQLIQTGVSVNELVNPAPKPEPVVKEFAEQGLEEAKPYAPEAAQSDTGSVHGHWTAKAMAEGRGPRGGSRSFVDQVSATQAPSGQGAAL